MPHLESGMSVAEIRELIFRLPPAEMLKIAREIEERAETIAMMRLSETAFQEWNDGRRHLRCRHLSPAKCGWCAFLSRTSQQQSLGQHWC